MIIGISGKKQSGKDLVGKIIQYLIYITNKDYNLTFEKYIDRDEEPVFHKSHMCGNYEIKKFATQLKKIVSIIINCNIEDLEDEHFKNKELGEEWRVWNCIINEEENMPEGNCMISNGLFKSKHEAEDFIKENNIINVTDIVTEVLTPRKLLQLFGTEAGRNIIHPNIWVNSLMNKYINNESNWIITDVRFINEIESIKDKKSINLRINRPYNLIYKEEWSDFILSGLAPTNNNFINYLLKSNNEQNKYLYNLLTHESETSLDEYSSFDYIINNNGTIDDLIGQIKNILIKEEII